MIVAGVGCRKGVDAETVLAGIAGGLSHYGLSAAQLDALATVPLKAMEPGLHAAAGRLGLKLIVVTEAALDSARTLSRSSASLAQTGAPSASEAAALAVAGPDGRLLGPRIATGSVTCAIAVSSTPSQEDAP